MIASPEQSKSRTAQLGEKSGSGSDRATILVVDDSPTSRMSLTRLLRDAGHRMIVAGDGEGALELVRAEHPDVVLTDILMPLMDGYEFARQLRADPSIARTPIIFHTACYELEEARLLADTCGVFHVLNKPAKPEELRRTIKAALKEVTLPAAAVSEEGFARAHR